MYRVTFHLFTDATLLHHVHSCDWRIQLIPREGEIIAFIDRTVPSANYKVHSVVYVHDSSESTAQVFINAYRPA